MGKRVLSMILALVLCAGFLPATARATVVASGICGDPAVNNGKNVTWSLDSDSVLTISGTGDMADWPTVSNIPRPNTPWISQEETVKTVVIESGVTSIGNYAFYRCVALTSVTIPDSITRIGSNAFYGCKSLTSVTIPDSVKNIGTGTFLHCASLTAITVGNGNTAYRDIDGVLFSSDGTLLITYPTGKTAQTYRIPTGVTSIGASAFAFCNALTSVTIPSSVTNIGYAAFNGYIETIALTDIYFGGSEAEWNTAIGENDIGLADTVTIHYSSSIVYTVTWMNDGVLMGTTEVAYGQMPSYNGETPTKAATAEKIYTFDGWSPLVTAVTSDVTYNATFKESDRLYTITFKDDDGGVLATKRYKYLETPEFSNPTKEPTVSQTFRFVGWAEAFSPVDGNKTYVANFEASPRKYTITWVDGNGIIIQTEQLPFGTTPTYNGVTPTKTADSQYTFTFGGWSPAIKSVTGDATYTAQFDILDNGSGVGAIVDGGYCGKGNDWEKLIWTLDDTGTLTISGSGAMKNYSATSSRAPWYSKRNSIQTVVMESGVTAIGNGAFSDCSGLTSVSIPSSVTSIGEWAFYSCGSLTSVSIPNSVTFIGYAAFSSCNCLTSVSIPGSVTSIGGWAFSSCSSLASACIASGITYIGDGTFQDCSSLTSVSIPNSITSIRGGTFERCSSLTSVSIPSGVTSIGLDAFEGCSSLTSVSIPSSVSSIEFEAFKNCSNLKDVYYGGSEEQWGKIRISSFNENLTNAAMHYNAVGGIPVPAVSIPGGKYCVRVVDGESGAPLVGATVVWNSTSATTGTDGCAYFSRFTFDQPQVTVSKSGYGAWNNRQSNWTKDKSLCSVVPLYRDALGGYQLASAQFSAKLDFSNTVNLLVSTKKLNLKNDGNLVGDLTSGEFFLSCAATKTDGITRYELWQREKQIATSADGNFGKLSVKSFSKGGGCFARVVTADGKNVDTHINLEFAENTVNKESSYTWKGASLSFAIKDDIPFVGGGTFDFSLPINVPIIYVQSESKT